MQTMTVESVADFIRMSCEVREKWTQENDSYFDPWFRGQRMASWELEPNIFRLELFDQEHEIRSQFRRRGRQLHSERELRDEWDWYFVMQHYRAPTRLLDWTDGALVALFFAINSNEPTQQEVESDAAVWMLDPWWLNNQVIRRDTILLPEFSEARAYLPRLYEHEVRPKLPVAIDPPHVAHRVGAQRSHFTIHGRNQDGLMEVAKRRRARIVKFVLPKEAIVRMRTDLGTCGVTDSTLFPDLEGLSRELTRFYLSEW